MSKSERINLCLTPEQKMVWQEYASKTERSLPDFIKYCVTVCITAYKRKEK